MIKLITFLFPAMIVLVVLAACGQQEDHYTVTGYTADDSNDESTNGTSSLVTSMEVGTPEQGKTIKADQVISPNNSDTSHPVRLAEVMQGPEDSNGTGETSRDSATEQAAAASTNGNLPISVTVEEPCNSSDALLKTCEPRDVSSIHLTPFEGTGAGQGPVRAPATVEELMEEGLLRLGSSPAHIAVRAMAQPGTTRCHWERNAFSARDRDESVRFWLNIASSDPLPSAAEIERRLVASTADISARYRPSWIANYQHLAHAGLSPHFAALVCIVDYQVNSYIVGSGPQNISVAFEWSNSAPSYDLYKRSRSAGLLSDEPLLSRGGFEAGLQDRLANAEQWLHDELAGRSNVILLSPFAANNSISLQAWQPIALWEVQQLEEDSTGGRSTRSTSTTLFNGVRYGIPQDSAEYSQRLNVLERRIADAARDDSFSGRRIGSIGAIENHYRSMGAYDDITPGDGLNTNFSPSPAPAQLDCATGVAVTNAATNRGLVRDCQTLLNIKDVLAGSGTLNWSKDLAIGSWTGVTTSGSPARVTGLNLANSSLNGTIPPEMGTLYSLTRLNLSGNRLSGEIHGELGLLFRLAELRLAGNSLTGCIPSELGNVATNDLGPLNLSICPPSPENLTTGSPGENSVALNWRAVPNTSRYMVQYRRSLSEDWVTHDDTVTTDSHTVDGLLCDKNYYFQVSSFGNGTAYAAVWSDPSAAESGITGANCVSPVFDAGPYALSVAAVTAVNTEVGTVTATDPNNDSVTYSITGGNGDGKFSINGGTGVITVAGALNEANAPTSYSLTVQASDGTNAVTVAVTVMVTGLTETG